MSDLKELLEGLSEQAPRYDVLARVHGRRLVRLRQRRVAGYSASVLAVVAIALTMLRLPLPGEYEPQTSPFGGHYDGRCVAERLDVPGNFAGSKVTAGDPSGRRLAGHAYRSDGRTHLITWDYGMATEIGPIGGNAEFTDIAESGVAVATATADTRTSWLHRDGANILLAGEDAEALAVNDTGTVAGQVAGRPAVWDDPKTEPRPLALPAGATGRVADISADGTVVGTIADNTGTHAYRWHPDGTGEELKLPEDIGADKVLEVRVGTVDGNWVVGSVRYTDGIQETTLLVRWNHVTGQKRWTIAPAQPDAFGGQGWSAGIAPPIDTPNGSHGGHAFLQDMGGQGDVLSDAEGAVTGLSTPEITVTALSRDGRALGGYQTVVRPTGGQTTAAVRWTCH
ncbi:hypothetical protein Cme02nite_27570 [Catellatospora methionotrophica]|uniref:Uncharacterized protein n=1 Tax=Catellatospora methionotrophica TaxID=121620 RepID=A0A8J3LH65_9ACTN|nr:hypothetical protein [Catellatospora methionotrophica]GIG14425.1 hypothetical protein Cme02nite_27570 [Catellatospora methionotrophica]